MKYYSNLFRAHWQYSQIVYCTLLFLPFLFKILSLTDGLEIGQHYRRHRHVHHHQNGLRSTKKTIARDKPPRSNWTIDYDAQLAADMLDFAAAAYAPDPSACLKRHDAVLERIDKLACDYVSNECWVFIARTPDSIIMSIRGTRTRLQLMIELFETMSAPKRLFPAGGSVQRYFYAAFDSIWSGAAYNETLRNLRKKYPDHRFIFTGHSLGGALSSMASVMFALENADLHVRDSTLLVTFGQPRVGNLEYSTVHDRLVPNSWRVIHRYDIVAHLPYCYETILSRECTPLYNHGPFHHGTEIWYPDEWMQANRSLYRICDGEPFNEDQSCSNGYYFHYRISDHLTYFVRDVDEYGNAGCVDDNRCRGMAGRRSRTTSEEDDRRENDTKYYLSLMRNKTNSLESGASL